MTTFIPLFILSMLGNPNPAMVRTDIDAPHNVICWSTPERAVCYGYSDEGTHLKVLLNREE